MKGCDQQTAHCRISTLAIHSFIVPHCCRPQRRKKGSNNQHVMTPTALSLGCRQAVIGFSPTVCHALICNLIECVVISHCLATNATVLRTCFVKSFSCVWLAWIGFEWLAHRVRVIHDLSSSFQQREGNPRLDISQPLIGWCASKVLVHKTITFHPIDAMPGKPAMPLIRHHVDRAEQPNHSLGWQNPGYPAKCCWVLGTGSLKGCEGFRSPALLAHQRRNEHEVSDAVLRARFILMRDPFPRVDTASRRDARASHPVSVGLLMEESSKPIPVLQRSTFNNWLTRHISHHGDQIKSRHRDVSFCCWPKVISKAGLSSSTRP